MFGLTSENGRISFSVTAKRKKELNTCELPGEDVIRSEDEGELEPPVPISNNEPSSSLGVRLLNVDEGGDDATPFCITSCVRNPALSNFLAGITFTIIVNTNSESIVSEFEVQHTSWGRKEGVKLKIACC